MPSAQRRFPTPWSVEEFDACFVVQDGTGQKLAFVYFENEPRRRSAAKLLSKDKAGRIAANVAKPRKLFREGGQMALTPEHRAELEVLGPETVRIRLMSSDKVAVISGFKTATTRSDLEGWLTEKRIEAESYRRQWWWALQAFVFASLATAVVLLSVDVKDRFLAIYSVSGFVGWLAGAIAYFYWSVLYAYQRKTKQRSVTWLLLGMSVAALLGFIWWLHYTMRF